MHSFGRVETFRCPTAGLWAYGLLSSDRLQTLGRNQHGQYCCGTANVSRNCQERFRQRLVRCRQSLKPCADTVKLIDFAQDLCKRHGHTAFSPNNLRWENFRWTDLGQKT